MAKIKKMRGDGAPQISPGVIRTQIDFRDGRRHQRCFSDHDGLHPV
jgi:hypothetical protein